jgi:Holliday junction resolvase
MSNAGIEFERELAKLLRDNGYDVVRGAASKGRLAGFDGDLYASRTTRGTCYEIGIAILQCKRSKRRGKR